eukprot:scaffold53496_cov88-Attheya_sp.AAC.1
MTSMSVVMAQQQLTRELRAKLKANKQNNSQSSHKSRNRLPSLRTRKKNDADMLRLEHAISKQIIQIIPLLHHLDPLSNNTNEDPTTTMHGLYLILGTEAELMTPSTTIKTTTVAKHDPMHPERRRQDNLLSSHRETSDSHKSLHSEGRTVAMKRSCDCDFNMVLGLDMTSLYLSCGLCHSIRPQSTRKRASIRNTDFTEN